MGWLDPVLNPLACLENIADDAPAETAEVFLKQLEAMLMRRVQQANTGNKPSLIRGQGLDFADLREYFPGDDIRKIDWNVFARTLHPHVREYHEEKQLTVWVFVDCTPSMFFGSKKSKAKMAIELTGLIGLLTHYGKNKLGVVCMTGSDSWVLAPASGYGHVQMAVQRLLDVEEQHHNRVMPVATGHFSDRLEELARVAGKQASVFVLSDFMAPDAQWQINLGGLSRNTSIYSLVLFDPVEESLPENVGLVPVFDPESGEVLEIDTRNKTLLLAYQTRWQNRFQELSQSLRSLGRVIPVSTQDDPVAVISAALSSKGGLAHV